MKERILSRIAAHGPMPFDEYMELCLYDFDDGYFTAGEVRAGTAGDFVTSPEVSPWFGRLIGRWARSLLRPESVIVEVGAGSGALLGPLLAEAGGNRSAHAVERSASARESLARIDGVTVSSSLDEGPEGGHAVVVMNEVIDNIPAKLVRWEGGWLEVLVGADGSGLRFESVPAPPSLDAWCDANLGPPDDRGNRQGAATLAASVRAAELLQAIIARFDSADICIIDYGGSTAELASRRESDVVRTFRGQRVGFTPLSDPGRTDITVEMNTDVVRRALHPASPTETDQASFLRSMGADVVLADLIDASHARARAGDVMGQLRARSEATDVRALLDPGGLGGFRVVCASSGT